MNHGRSGVFHKKCSAVLTYFCNGVGLMSLVVAIGLFHPFTALIAAPAPPSDLTASGVSETAIELNWVDNTNSEVGFRIERSVDGLADWQEIGTVPANTSTYTDSGLERCAQWSYRVRAYNSGVDSNPSNVAAAQVLTTAELCDGLDNDCDGSTDEDFPTLGDSCSVGTGACEATGVLVCTVEGADVECDATPGTPAADDATCDGVDDDCDGSADEDYVSDESCFLPGACAAGNSGSTCVDGIESGCVTGTPAANDVTCDGVDDDCDGSSDEDGCPLWYDCQAADLGGGWYWLDWWGYFNLASNPWVYHLQHRFLYPFGDSCDTGIVFWDSGMQAFWWTSASVYPYVYRFSDGEWLWYEIDSVDPRWFVTVSSGLWEEW